MLPVQREDHYFTSEVDLVTHTYDNFETHNLITTRNTI